jgi:hypothetical protein
MALTHPFDLANLAAPSFELGIPLAYAIRPRRFRRQHAATHGVDAL